MVVFIKYLWRKLVLWDKKDWLTWLFCDEGCMREVTMSKNEQLEWKAVFLGDWIFKCELLQVLTIADIKRCFEKKLLLEF